VKVNKRIVSSTKSLVLLLSLSGLVCACVSPESGTTRIANEERQPVPVQRVTSHLKQQFEEIEVSEFLPVIIRLFETSDLRMASRVIEAAGKSHRRDAVISHLRQHALNTQSEILDSLSALQTAGLARKRQIRRRRFFSRTRPGASSKSIRPTHGYRRPVDIQAKVLWSQSSIAGPISIIRIW
jgi:hypothetical protein